MNKENKVKVTVYVSREFKEYLKSRKIPMSKWIRSAIKQKRSLHKSLREYNRKRRNRDLDFASKEREKLNEFAKSKVDRVIKNVNDGIPLSYANKVNAKKKVQEREELRVIKHRIKYY